MSLGLSGEAIGLGTANPNPIGGATKATADGTTTGRGSLENFIGYALDGVFTDPSPEDFSAAKNTVTNAATGNQQQEPTYVGEVGKWMAVTP